MSNNPYQAPSGFDPGNPGGGPNRSAALARVSGPSIGLLVTGVLNILFSLYGVGTSILFMAGMMPGADMQRKQMEDAIQQNPDQAQFFELMIKWMELAQGPVGVALNSMTLVVGILIIFGALKMKRLESYGLALTGIILAMIPCVSNCCIIGLPIGIWALVVIMSDDVKRAFR